MNAEKCCKIGGAGGFVALLCCFGVLGALLGLFGAAGAIAYVNNYGDYVFFPAYSFFATLFVYGLLNWKKNFGTYVLSAVAVGFGLFFAKFGLLYAGLILAGLIIGLLLVLGSKK